MADLSHLLGRCGSCSRWSPIDLGSGTCDLPSQTSGPMALSDPGGLYTRIDFSCGWHEPEAWTPPPPVIEQLLAKAEDPVDLDRPDLDVYQVFWDDGLSSVASIYMDRKGNRWLAPTNWTSPGLLRNHRHHIIALHPLGPTDG